MGTLVTLLGDPKARGWHPRVLLALAAFAYDRAALEELEGMGLVAVLAKVLSDGVGGLGGFGGVGGGVGMGGGGEGGEEEEAASCDVPRDAAVEGGGGGDGAEGSWRGLK